MLPQRFYVHQQSAWGDRHVYASRSRFIPQAIAAHFEACVWPPAAPRDAGGEAQGMPPGPPVDVVARVRALWS